MLVHIAFMHDLSRAVLVQIVCMLDFVRRRRGVNLIGEKLAEGMYKLQCEMGRRRRLETGPKDELLTNYVVDPRRVGSIQPVQGI